MGGFFPGTKYGGPPVSIKNFCELVSNCDIYIVTTNHDLNDKNTYENLKSGWNNLNGKAKILYLGDEDFNYRHFKKIFLEVKPDLVYLQSLFEGCVLPSLKLAKKNAIPVFLAPRGEVCDGAFSRKKTKKLVYIFYLKFFGLLQNVFFQATSSEELDSIKSRLNVSEKMIFMLGNIPSNPTNVVLERKRGTNDYIRIVFVSRIHPKKNLLYSLSILSTASRKIDFDIYGPIEDTEYWEKCVAVMKKMPPNIRVNYRGFLEHNAVQSTLSEYDLFLFPTLSENYGHVIMESLSAGTPVLISDNTPWNDLEDYHAGWSVSLSDQEKFKRIINEFPMSKLRNEYRLSAFNYYVRVSNLDSLKKKYEHTLESILNEVS